MPILLSETRFTSSGGLEGTTQDNEVVALHTPTQCVLIFGINDPNGDPKFPMEALMRKARGDKDRYYHIPGIQNAQAVTETKMVMPYTVYRGEHRGIRVQ